MYRRYSLGRSGNILLTGITVLFFLHQWLQKVLKISMPYIDNYYDMFAFGFILTFLYSSEKKYKFNTDYHSKVKNIELVAIFIVGSLISEGLFPIVSSRFTADPLDCIPYLSGILLFAWSQKPFSNRHLS